MWQASSYELRAIELHRTVQCASLQRLSVDL